MNSSISRIHQEFTWCFTNLLWIHYLFRESLMSSLRVSRIYFELTVFIANLIRILRVFREYISYSLWNYYYFREFTINSLFLSQIYQEFTCFFANLLWIHFQFRELNNTHKVLQNTHGTSRIHYDFTKCTISPWIHYEFTMNLSTFSTTITFYLLRIHYLYYKE